ncbi:SpoIID/LytB domain-containing protein [Cytobacillus suaedae]|nr:SpoIID/LytB domain-containing protein [Cytobacillus suaedae]
MFQKLVKYSFIVLLVSALLLQGVGGTAATTESAEPIVRIGVEPEKETITLGSDGDYVVTDKVTGDVLFEGSNSLVEVTLDSSALIKTNFRLQVAATSNNAYIDDWVNRAEAAGYTTYLEPVGNLYRLFIGEFASDAPESERVAFKTEMIRLGLAGSDSFWKTVTIVEGESKLKVTSGDVSKTTTNSVVITSSNNLIKINGKKYRGLGEVAFNSKGTLAGINELPIEEYLYGVVPRELPPVPYGELEAQKSQAVAARTYAMSNLGKRSNDGYDLLPTTSDQVYAGFGAEHPVSNQAVDETKGIVATYDGKLITAVFNSTSGGFSANNEDVWNSEAVPYLRGVPDAERGKALQHVPSLEVFKNHSNSKSLRAAAEGDFESDWSRYHRWNFEWTSEEISDVLSTYYNKEVGKVYEINVLERSNSGRVLKIEFVTENGTFYEYKDKVRWALKYINASGNQASLLSTLFYIEPVVDNKTKEVTGFKTYGGGWGHGVGLSQTGAMGMAVKGYKFEEILKHYYQGIKLEKSY